MRRWLVQLLVGALAAGSGPAQAEEVPAAGPLPDLRGRQILAFDARGDGRIVEAVGDVRAAARIAIIVPGADTTVRNFDDGHGGVRRRSPSWQARRLQEATGGQVAVIAWLGYDPPEGIGLAAARSSRALDGARELTRLVERLAAGNPRATIALIGHSYGSVLLGRAAAGLPPQVTDLVSVGSPGMDVRAAVDLGTAARVWAGTAPTDWTLRLPDLRVLGLGHGTNPTRDGFGALHLDVAGAEGHDGYFVPGTRSLRSLAEVATGVSSSPPAPAAARSRG